MSKDLKKVVETGTKETGETPLWKEEGRSYTLRGLRTRIRRATRD